jgi:hypothetical protein
MRNIGRLKFFKKSYEATRPIMYGSSLEALKEIMESDGCVEVVRITPKDYKLSNGIDYCSVGLKTINGDYSIQAYGIEAIELHEKASFMVERPLLLVQYVK